MDVERIIDEIEQLQEMFEAPDIRPLNPSDLRAANRRHDEMLAHSPWFRLWHRTHTDSRSFELRSELVLINGLPGDQQSDSTPRGTTFPLS
jgi:hypothetical protein